MQVFVDTSDTTLRCPPTTTTEERSLVTANADIIEPVLSDKTWTNQFGVSVAVQYEVLRFQVSVYDAFGMQVGKGFDHAARVKASGWIIEGAPEKQPGKHSSEAGALRMALGNKSTSHQR